MFKKIASFSDDIWNLIESILDAALEAVDPHRVVSAICRLEGSQLWIEKHCFDLNEFDRVWIIGFGKASLQMARALLDLLGNRIHAGIAIVKDSHGVTSLDQIKIRQAEHPIPTEANLASSNELLSMIEEIAPRDFVIFLVSGGGSALLTAPKPGVTIAMKRAVTEALLGAPIAELNCVRKQLSRVKGGKLAELIYPAPAATLVLSDVIGNSLSDIASGPTYPNNTTVSDALAILKKYNCASKPGCEEVIRFLQREEKEQQDSEQIAKIASASIPHFIVADIMSACKAAEQKARERGFNTLVLSRFIQGEAREIAAIISEIPKRISIFDLPLPKPACVILGGETTVTVKEKNYGGRNQEFALAAAMTIQNWSGITIVSMATDGDDGIHPSDQSPVAGAVVDASSINCANALGLNAAEALDRNNSYNFFSALDQHLIYLRQEGNRLVPGITETNVNDLILILVT